MSRSKKRSEEIGRQMRFFGNLHPAVSMAYFVLVLVLTLICMHPVTVLLSFLGASWFSIRLRGGKAYGRTMRFVAPMFILIASANPLFNHRGVTPLFEINHLWYTLEATVYGLVSACSLCAVIIWFTCYQEVMTSDKFLYLFGKPFPGTSLLITMTLRFIPQLQQNRKEIKESQAMLKEEGTRLFQKMGTALRNLSVLLTMSMENAVETADSMKARGYGARRRTTFHLFRFDGRDARTLGAILAVGGICILARCFGHGTMDFYPRMTPVILGPATYTLFVFYAVLMFLPGILETVEEIRWRSCVSKI